MRAPALRIAGVSAACISPSIVQSTTKPACPSAATTGASPPIAALAPVERTGTGCGLRGVGTTMWNGLAPSRNSASSARCTLSGARLRFREDRGGVAGLDRATLEDLAKASIHLPSMRSANMPGAYLPAVLHEKEYF